MADSGDTAARPASATPRETTIKCLSDFTDANGLHPFGHLDSVVAMDRCSCILSQASLMLSFMSAAFNDSELPKSEVASLTGPVVSGALDGVQTLVSLAHFLIDDVEGR